MLLKDAQTYFRIRLYDAVRSETLLNATRPFDLEGPHFFYGNPK